MDAQLLRAFTVLAQELHFRRAAERLNIAQPTLTQLQRKILSSLSKKNFNSWFFPKVPITSSINFVYLEKGKILITFL